MVRYTIPPIAYNKDFTYEAYNMHMYDLILLSFLTTNANFTESKNLCNAFFSTTTTF